MRKLVQILLVVCMVVLSAQVAFAYSDKETVYEGADLKSVHRLAIGLPLYTPVGDKAATKEELTQAIADASKGIRTYVVSYNEAAKAIKADKGVDILALERHKAADEFKKNVDKYADAYVILTVANNSGIAFFFDVYKTGTDEMLYTYQIAANRYQDPTVTTYKMLSEEFFRHFETAAAEQQKKAAKEAKKKK